MRNELMRKCPINNWILKSEMSLCQVSDEKKCEPEDRIVSFYIFDHDWLYFSNHSAIYQIFLSNFTLMADIESNICMKNKYDIQNYDLFCIICIS